MRALLSLLLSAVLTLTTAVSIPPYSREDPCNPTDIPVSLFAPDAWYLLNTTLQLPEEPWVNGPEDVFYLLPNESEIADLVSFYQHRREPIPYTPESFDCDDLATEWKYWATIWSLHHFERPHAALLVGKAYVHVHGPYDLFPALKGTYIDSYHVIGFIVRSDGQVLFFEPQSGLLLPAEGFIYEDSLTVMRLEY